MGGATSFESRLDYIFQPNTSQQDLGVNGLGITTIMNIGNEPDFATPYLYNYLNKQWKSVAQSRQLANTYVRDAPHGVPGNSDAGALNSWLVWQMLGIYPVVPQTTYLLASPWFDEINMSVNGNANLKITARANATTAAGGFGQAGYSVQSVKVNGKAWEKNWFAHEDVMVSGGTIEFVLGDQPVAWEKGDVPPSPGHVTL
jgi:putative alpha-1,2-mannosidase